MALTAKLKARFTRARTHIAKLCYENGMLDEFHYWNAGVPTDGTSGTFAGIAPTGAECIDSTNGDTYQNTNTQASPTWTFISTRTST